MPGRPTILICAPRLGRHDGVSIEAAKWSAALVRLGCEVRTLAGEGVADRLLAGLASEAPLPPDPDELAGALAGADLVVVENLCSLPLNPAASRAVAAALAGRPAILHHHDLASQRPALSHHFPPPDDPCWVHVAINDLSAGELAQAGIVARVVRNRFDPDPPAGRRQLARRLLRVAPSDRLLLHPVRAIPRKNIPTALSIAERAGAVYWLLGPAEDGYGPELERLLTDTPARVVRGWPTPCAGEPAGTDVAGAAATGEPTPGGAALDIDDAYAACDGVLLPSSWEGFGNPAVEAATHERPLAIGDYPVASELRQLGFEFFDAGDDDGVKAFCHLLDCPDPDLMSRNRAVARRELALDDLPIALAEVLDAVPGAPIRSW